MHNNTYLQKNIYTCILQQKTFFVPPVNGCTALDVNDVSKFGPNLIHKNVVYYINQHLITVLCT